MSLTGITFSNQKVTPSDDGRLYSAMLSDGILTGCGITFAAATLSIAAGSLLVGGRELRTSGETLSITGATSGYARVLIDIDLTRAATKDTFEQARWVIQYASSVSAFPALVQQDINAAGTHRQSVFCVLALGSAGIASITSRMSAAATPVANGGTGATTAAAARTNLGITPANIGALSTAAGAVGTDNLGSKVVTRGKIADGAVGTDQITNDAVTLSKMSSSVRYDSIISVTAGRDIGSGWNRCVIVTDSTGSRIEIAIRQGYEENLPVGFKFRIIAKVNTILWIAGYNSVNATFFSLGEREKYTNVNNKMFSIPANRYMDVQKTAENTWVLSGNYADPIISGGTAAPSGGSNGDIYIQYSAASSANAVSKADVIGAADAVNEAGSPVSEADAVIEAPEADVIGIAEGVD